MVKPTKRARKQEAVDVKPNSERGQPANDAPEEEQKESTNGSKSKRARTATKAAATNAVDSGVDATAAAAAASPPDSCPASRCYLDHLSPAFSFLETKDFGCALRVSKRWHSIGLLKSAWPVMDLAALTAAPMRFSICPALQYLCVQKPPPRVSVSLVKAVDGAWSHNNALNSIVASAVWAPHTRHLHMIGNRDVETSSDLLAASTLPNLTSLALDTFVVSEEAAMQAFGAMAPRLVAFSVDVGRLPAVYSLGIPLLTQLRWLALNGAISAAALAPLHQLEFLHLYPSAVSAEVYGAIRRLSVAHKLRSFMLSGPALFSEDEFDPMAALVDPELQDKPALLTEVTTMVGFIDPALLSLPALADLTVGIDRCCLPPLEMPEWLPCGSKGSPGVSTSIVRLRVADLTGSSEVWPRALGRYMPAVERIVTNRALSTIRSDLSLFRSLRSLEVTDGDCEPLPLRQLKALAALPHFTTLRVVVLPGFMQPPQLLLTDPRVLCRSSSWRAIVLVLSLSQFFRTGSYALKAYEFNALKNLRLHVHYLQRGRRPKCTVFALAPLAAGSNKYGWTAPEQASFQCAEGF